MASPPVEVRPVASRRDLKRFVEFAWQVYAQDPYWAPPLLSEVYEFLDPRKHPFLRHGQRELFLAWRQGRVVGRIMASDDPHYNEAHGSNIGCFGQFETVDDPAVATALLEAAADWLRSKGRSDIMGPVDYSTNYTCGLLIDGFNMPPRVMMNHNPSYYRPLLEGWGLNKAKDLYAWWFIDPDDMLNKWQARADRLAQRGSVTLRPVQVKDVEGELATIADIYNQAWEHNWGSVKMTQEEFAYQAQKLLPIMIPELLMFAEFKGRPVGFAMTLPDVNEAISPLNGRLTRWGLPIGLWRLFRNLKRIRTCRLVMLGVLSEFRRRGVAELLILKTLDHGKNVVNFNAAELGWTLEDNTLINRTIEAVGGTRYKTYRIYDRAI